MTHWLSLHVCEPRHLIIHLAQILEQPFEIIESPPYSSQVNYYIQVSLSTSLKLKVN